MYIYMYMQVYICMYMYVYVYTCEYIYICMNLVSVVRNCYVYSIRRSKV